jgi:hypothetical protein
MPVPPVRRSDPILVGQRHADAHGDRLLTRVKVGGAGDATRLSLAVDPGLEDPDRLHGTVGFEEAVTR